MSNPIKKMRLLLAGNQAYYAFLRNNSFTKLGNLLLTEYSKALSRHSIGTKQSALAVCNSSRKTISAQLKTGISWTSGTTIIFFTRGVARIRHRNSLQAVQKSSAPTVIKSSDMAATEHIQSLLREAAKAFTLSYEQPFGYSAQNRLNGGRAEHRHAL